MSFVKKLAAGVCVVLCLVNLAACGSDWSRPEEMTDKQLLAEAQKQDKFPVKGFYVPDTFGVKMKENESWQQVWMNSARTQEEARDAVENYVDRQSFHSYEITYIGQKDYYYQFRLTCYGHSYYDYVYNYRMIVWKADALLCSFNDVTWYNFEIRKLDKTSVRNILDLFFYNYTFESARIIHRELTEDSAYFYYTFYETSIMRGNWGMSDTANLAKKQSRISKQTGKLERDYFYETIKSVTIPGTKK
jgi:hypothetical protein